MNVAWKVVVAVVVLVLLAGAALRIRKLRRDEMRELSKPVERRLMTPPPSPYATSKGFRLLDGPIEATQPGQPARPRLETDRSYVFSETQMSAPDDVRPAAQRHQVDWALSRSDRRSSLSSTGLRVAVFALIAVLAVGTVGYLVQHHSSAQTGSTTTTTSRATANSTTSTPPRWPSSFVAVSRSGQFVTYRIPSSTYQVVVTGALGATYALYQMGPEQTIEWQGTLARGQSESLRLTGNAIITIGAPRDASVTVGGSPVVFPSPPPSPLTLRLVGATPG